MANVLRGQIYVTKFDKKIRDEKGKVTSVQNGFRPALIIQNDTGNANSTTTIVAPLTSKLDKPALPTHSSVTVLPTLPASDTALNRGFLILSLRNIPLSTIGINEMRFPSSATPLAI